MGSVLNSGLPNKNELTKIMCYFLAYKDMNQGTMIKLLFQAEQPKLIR
jgi:hypothetical protein